MVTYPHIYKVWYPHTSISTKYGILIPPHSQGVISFYPHIYKVWYPYSPTFTRCGNLIQSNITNHLTNVTGSKYKIFNPLFQKLT